jgi:esterase/lipase superfamily enzyme
MPDRQKATWFSERMRTEASLVRWGHFGKPVLLLPTAGGDCEEIERWHVIDVLMPLIDAGKIKVYSCDSVAGRVMLKQEGSPEYRMAMLNAFHQYVRHEVVPAIRMDCKDDQVEIIAAGASIGAFHAVAVLCRWPQIFSHALGLSGTYELLRFLGHPAPSDDYKVSSPLQFLPSLSGMHLDKLRTRFAMIATGAGRAENVGESWNIARALGARGVPNRMDDWGTDWPHDWVTWRKMFPQYLEEWTR